MERERGGEEVLEGVEERCIQTLAEGEEEEGVSDSEGEEEEARGAEARRAMGEGEETVPETAVAVKAGEEREAWKEARKGDEREEGPTEVCWEVEETEAETVAVGEWAVEEKAEVEKVVGGTVEEMLVERVVHERRVRL